MSDRYFRGILGVAPRAGPGEIRRSYHRLARLNHPDLFPDEEKPLQELKMMALNEAYTALLSLVEEEEPGAAAGNEPQPEDRAQRGPEAGDARALSLPRDPPYTYYKQGFLNFSRAIQGIAAIHQGIRARPRFQPMDQEIRRFADGLRDLRRAHRYFQTVIDQYEDSIWSRDARIKLERIESFTSLYRRILANLQGC